MYDNEIKMMVRISKAVGDRIDYIQAGGGNTSVKFDDRILAVKASGYQLQETTQSKGYVTVDYPRIKKFFDEADLNSGLDLDKQSLEISLNSMELLPDMENRRPSVEVGFHAFMKRCVIHSHSVYINIMCCSKEGRELAAKIFDGSGISYAYVPYVNPGFLLAYTIKLAYEKYLDEHGAPPKVVFMQNHGVVVCDDDPEVVIELHEKVNDKIRDYINPGEFENPKIKKTAEGFASDTQFLKKWTVGREKFIRELRLYPDQLLYVTQHMDTITKIDNETGEITYNTSERMARSIEDTLVGVAYVVDEIEKAGLTLSQMTEKEAAFITNWESEKYKEAFMK